MDIYSTYESVLVGNVIGQFEFMEGHHLLHPLLARRGRVGMNIHPFGHFRIRLAGDHPAGIMELIAAVVNGDNIHEQDVLCSLV